MRNFKSIIAVLAIVAFCTMSFFVYADTSRQSMYSPDISSTYNAHSYVAKTANYTALATDDYIAVTCSSADITITLPSVSTVRGSYGNKSYKILKTDATPYSVVVASASGDTIGGETSRKVVQQNGYIIISMGSGNDWKVQYESSYVTENHKSGSVSNISTSWCGTTSTCAGTSMIVGTKIVAGSVALSGGTVTVGSLPAFTSSSTFKCTVSDATATTSAAIVSNASSTAITITGNGTDTINYICVGY